MARALADYQADLELIEEELANLIGSVSGGIAGFTIDQGEAYDRLCANRKRITDMIEMLGGGSTSTRNATMTTASHTLYTREDD